MASRLLRGARVSLGVGFSAVVLVGVVGVGLGLAALGARCGQIILGLGIPAPAPSWGATLDEGRNYITTGWWLARFPASRVIFEIMLAPAWRPLKSLRQGGLKRCFQPSTGWGSSVESRKERCRTSPCSKADAC